MADRLRAMYKNVREKIPACPTGKIGEWHFCKSCFYTCRTDPRWQGEQVRLTNNANKSPKQKGTHCRRGHAFTPENTYTHNGLRSCKECISIRRAANYQKKIGSPS